MCFLCHLPHCLCLRMDSLHWGRFSYIAAEFIKAEICLCLLQVCAAWGLHVLVQEWLWISRSTRDFSLTLKLRISPGFGWNTETIGSFDQLKAKMGNNHQSNATAAIPYTVICTWARWLILSEENERLQQSQAAEVCLEKRTAVWGNNSDKLRAAFSFLPGNKQATGQSFMNYWSFVLWCLYFFVFSCCWRSIYWLLNICFNCSTCSVAGPCCH